MRAESVQMVIPDRCQRPRPGKCRSTNRHSGGLRLRSAQWKSNPSAMQDSFGLLENQVMAPSNRPWARRMAKIFFHLKSLPFLAKEAMKVLRTKSWEMSRPAGDASSITKTVRRFFAHDLRVAVAAGALARGAASRVQAMRDRFNIAASPTTSRRRTRSFLAQRALAPSESSALETAAARTGIGEASSTGGGGAPESPLCGPRPDPH